MYQDSTEVCCGVSDRFPEREECRGYSAAVWWEGKESPRRAFLGAGYAVSTVGFELEAVKRYIREQEQLDQDGRF
jgi:hypothetical protein